MRALLQRVVHASVSVNGRTIAECGPGLMILLGIGHNDGEEQIRFLEVEESFFSCRDILSYLCLSFCELPWACAVPEAKTGLRIDFV